MHVRSPDGEAWNVTRRWLPWRRRTRAEDVDPDLGTGGGIDVALDDPVALALGLVVLVVVALLLPFVLPTVVAVIEVVVLLVLLPGAVVLRVVGVKAWEVEVRPAVHRVFSRRPVHTEQAGGWRSSRRCIHAIADEIRRGERRWDNA